MKKLLLYTLCCAVIFSCKKKDLPPESEGNGAPVFYLKCEINGIPLKIEAGVNSYHMNTSRYQDSNNVYVYKGELRQASCSGGCSYAVAIMVNDYKVSALNGATNVDSGLVAGVHRFDAGNFKPDYYTCSFTPQEMSDSKIFEWHLSNGDVTHAPGYLGNLSAGQTYWVALASYDPKGCSTTHTNVFRVGNALQTNITAVSSTGKYTFSATTGNKGPYTYAWDFGDGSVSSDAQPAHAFAQGDYITSLTLTNAAHDTCISYYQVSSSGCTANFNSTFLPVVNPNVLSAITLQVTDQNGVTYSSADLDQPSDSRFEIVSVEEYKMNENNERTKKLKIVFNCTLKDPANPISITNGEAVIAVPYK